LNVNTNVVWLGSTGASYRAPAPGQVDAAPLVTVWKPSIHCHVTVSPGLIDTSDGTNEKPVTLMVTLLALANGASAPSDNSVKSHLAFMSSHSG
jgi:hypothetical protein